MAPPAQALPTAPIPADQAAIGLTRPLDGVARLIYDAPAATAAMSTFPAGQTPPRRVQPLADRRSIIQPHVLRQRRLTSR